MARLLTVLLAVLACTVASVAAAPAPAPTPTRILGATTPGLNVYTQLSIINTVNITSANGTSTTTALLCNNLGARASYSDDANNTDSFGCLAGNYSTYYSYNPTTKLYGSYAQAGARLYCDPAAFINSSSTGLGIVTIGTSQGVVPCKTNNDCIAGSYCSSTTTDTGTLTGNNCYPIAPISCLQGLTQCHYDCYNFAGSVVTGEALKAAAVAKCTAYNVANTPVIFSSGPGYFANNSNATPEAGCTFSACTTFVNSGYGANYTNCEHATAEWMQLTNPANTTSSAARVNANVGCTACPAPPSSTA